MAEIGESSNSAGSSYIGVDPINILPDHVITAILSRLPTKEVVRTSVLSKAWRRTWTGITSFDFDDQMQNHLASVEEMEKFSRFVQDVLQHCSMSRIQNFSLTCSQRYDKARVHEWISHVLRSGVRSLFLHHRAGRMSFPSCFFACQTLEEVRLLMPCILNMPLQTTFRNLKIMYITRVIMEKENDSNPGGLTFSFPLLEEFTMISCVWKNVNALKVIAPLLSMFQMSWCKYENDSNQRVESFTVDIASSTCLKTFKWAGYFLENLVLPRPPTVSVASVDHIVEINDLRKTGIDAALLLRHLSSLVHLEICIDIAEALNRAGRTESIPVFERLRSMKVDSGFTGSTKALLELLRRTPNLKVLDIHVASMAWKHDDLGVSRPLPLCVVFKLEKVYFTFRYGSHLGLQFVKLLLRHARVLELLHVDAPKVSYVAKVDIKMQLLMTHRASRNAVIVVENLE